MVVETKVDEIEEYVKYVEYMCISAKNVICQSIQE